VTANDIGSVIPDDDALSRLLAAEGVALSPAALRELVAGVTAAPPGFDPDGWMTLVAADPSPALKHALQAVHDQVARGAPPAADGPGERLAALRAALADRDLAGFVVPRADEYQGEYVPPSAQRLAWLTGFTGSAGVAVMLADRAALFVDGRYTLQAADEVAEDLFTVVAIAETTPEAWIQSNLTEGSRLGFDPRLHSRAGAKRLEAACAKAAGHLIAVDPNPLDAIWRDRPPAPIAPVLAHDLAFAGRSAADKRADLAARLDSGETDAVVLTMADSVAWLLNLRGGDVAFTPLALSFAILHRDSSVDLFIDRRKLAPGTDGHLGNRVAPQPLEAFGPALAALGADGKRVQVDPATASAWVFDQLTAAGARAVEARDPCALPKAKKNPVELAGIRAAHLRDGMALTRFLHWLDAAGADAAVTEIQAADRLEAFRRQGEHFRGSSFPTIAGSGAHGAIVHYRVTEASDRALGAGELLLLDSGAQYLDGTTDVTRTIAIGEPSTEMRDRFTRVLKGHIALATAIFPAGTKGGQIDALARAALWRGGLDYDHGTGHGVGSYLSVHEGPQRIAKTGGEGAALEPGMIVSNEPGYYKTGAYGIRIENLVCVVAHDAPPGAEHDLLAFETLTRAPIDRTLIDPALLTEPERAWLDAYHATVRDSLTPLLDDAVGTWLAEATRPL
jgi:Xaa-Pro aminopeptidase